VKTTSLDAAEGAAGRQVLTFRLGSETYGIDILHVKEIRGWAPVTTLPQLPSHVLGVLNLRGAVVPVIDLRRQFALDSAEFSPTTVTIVLSSEQDHDSRDCGIVVDAVADVVDIAADAIRPTPDLGGHPRSPFILGLVIVEHRTLIILDAQHLTARSAASLPAVADAA
jgi:purine-binding chemotaxis protein CheW